MLIAMWLIWCARNVKVFVGDSSPTQVMAAKYTSIHLHISQAFQQLEGVRHRPLREVSWARAGSHTFVLNVDGSALQNPGIAGVGEWSVTLRAGLSWAFMVRLGTHRSFMRRFLLCYMG